MGIRTNYIDTSRSSSSDYTISHQRNSCSISNRIDITDDSYTGKKSTKLIMTKIY